MGCCFSKELNFNPVGERTSLLQTPVSEHCSDQEAKQYSTVSRQASTECGQTNRAVDASSCNLSASPGSIDKRSSSVQDRAALWDKPRDEPRDDSRGKPPRGVSKNSDVQARTGTAVLSTVKRRIAENALKRANWFCDIDMSRHADPTGFKARCENTAASDTHGANGPHVSATCPLDNIHAEVSLQEPADSRVTQKAKVFFTARNDDYLDSAEKRLDFLTSERSMNTRTQSFYSICSIDADDLEGEREPSATEHRPVLDHTGVLNNTEAQVFINTSLSPAALETVNMTQEDSEKVSEDLKAAHVLPDVIGTFCDVGPTESIASDKHVSAPSEDGVMEKHEHMTGLHKTVDEIIPDLLERKSESTVDRRDMEHWCQARVHTDAELINVVREEVTEPETSQQESGRVSSESRSLDNKENILIGREPSPSRTWHELAPCSCLKPHQGSLCPENTSVAQVIENPPPSVVTSLLESDLKSRGVFTETSFQDIHLFPTATEPEPGPQLSSPQSFSSFTLDISGGNDDTLQLGMFQTGLVDHLGLDDAHSLLREINLGTEDATHTVSFPEPSDGAPGSVITDEHVDTCKDPVHINPNADYEDLLKANQCLLKEFSENVTSLRRMEQEISPSPLHHTTSSDADSSVHISLLSNSIQNPEDLKVCEKQMFPAAAQEEDRCCLKGNATLVKEECFNQHDLEGADQISLSVSRVKSPEMEVQESKPTDSDLSPGRNNDEQVIHLFLESGGDDPALSLHSPRHTETPDAFESTTLSKNSTQCENAHVPTHSLLGNADMQSFSDPSNQEPEGDLQHVQMISSAEQQVVEFDYRAPLGRTIRPVFKIGEPENGSEEPDSSDEGVERFVTSRLQGYQLNGLHVSGPSRDFGTDGMCPVINFSANNKAIALPVEPDQVDLYASLPSYEIHFLGPDQVTVENPASLTSTNDSERERGVLNMVSELLGKSEANEEGDGGHFLSVWAGEPELESAWQYRVSEGQGEGKPDSALDSERVQAFAAAYPYSLLVPDGACVWDWQHAVSLRQCRVASSLI